MKEQTRELLKVNEFRISAVKSLFELGYTNLVGVNIQLKPGTEPKFSKPQ